MKSQNILSYHCCNLQLTIYICIIFSKIALWDFIPKFKLDYSWFFPFFSCIFLFFVFLIVFYFCFFISSCFSCNTFCLTFEHNYVHCDIYAVVKHLTVNARKENSLCICLCVYIYRYTYICRYMYISFGATT